MSAEKKLPEYKPTERDNTLEAMAQQVHERRMAELGVTDEPGDETEAETAAEATVETPESVTETPTEPVVETPKVEDQVTKQMRKVKVDGIELEVSEDDLVASYQKQAAATRRLQEADRILAEARATAAATVASATTTQQTQAAQDREAKVKEYHDALFTGDVETAARLFDEVVVGRQQPIPDATAILQEAMPVIKQQLSDESAYDRVKTEYADALQNEDFTVLAKSRLDRLMAEGKPYAVALPEAAKHASDALKLSAPTTTPTTTQRTEKLDRKAAIVQIPTTNARAASTAEREETASDVVRSMRKARGLE